MIQSAERISQDEASDNYVFQRSILAYHKAGEMVSGRVLEIGTGSGYGIEIVSPVADHFMTIDKTPPSADLYQGKPGVVFKQLSVPPLEGIPSESFDYVISFQVLEHIKDDVHTIAEIHRVLKSGGKLIISTPNKKMSLTRNPWHVREYSPEDFKRLLGCVFSSVEALGVFGNEKVLEYYEDNRKSVQAVLKYDILKLNRNLPRWMLKLPYDIMNRRNRNKLLRNNSVLTTSIRMEDYYFGKADDSSFDLYYIAEK